MADVFSTGESSRMGFRQRIWVIDFVLIPHGLPTAKYLKTKDLQKNKKYKRPLKLLLMRLYP